MTRSIGEQLSDVALNPTAPKHSPQPATDDVATKDFRQLQAQGLASPIEANSDMALSSSPVARREGKIVELTCYQQSGKIDVDGDTVTQDVGRGKTAEYSLSQLAAHSKDPDYLGNMLRYAAKHGDSVKIDVHDGIVGVRDPTLEQRLPENIPLRDPILHAAVKHDVDPVLLAAVGTQETHLGANYFGSSEPDYNMKTHRGDVERDSIGGHGYGPFQLDDRSHVPADLTRAASDPYFAADTAASMLSKNLKAHGGDVDKALHVYNAGKLTVPSSTTDWGPLGKLSYQDSTMRYYREIAASAAHEQRQRSGPSR